MEDKKSYFAVIPANVRYDKRLKLLSRLLYGEITALCNQEGYCWATNKYFAELYEVSITTISTCINQLKEFGYIDVEIIYKEGTKEILKRYLKIFKDPIQKKLNTPIQENLKDNNTFNINSEAQQPEQNNSNIGNNKQNGQLFNTKKKPTKKNSNKFVEITQEVLGNYSQNVLEIIMEFYNVRRAKGLTHSGWKLILEDFKVKIHNMPEQLIIESVKHCIKRDYMDLYIIDNSSQKQQFQSQPVRQKNINFEPGTKSDVF